MASDHAVSDSLVSEMPGDTSQDAGAEPLRVTGLSVAAALGGLTAEAAIVVLLCGLSITPLVAATLHLAVVATLGGWVWREVRAQKDVRLPGLLVATTALLGPFGAAGLLLTLARVGVYARTATPFQEWYESLFPEEQLTLSARLLAGMTIGRGGAAGLVRVGPFIDVLSFGTQDQKRAVISLIAAHFRPAFGPVLRKALSDERNAIRVQAAAVIAKIEKRLTARTLELSAAVRATPADPDLLLSLARHCGFYAYSGIFDMKVERDNRDMALAAYREYLKLRPDDAVANRVVGRLLVRQGAHSEAAAWLERSMELEHSSPESVLWYMEALFRLGRFHDLRETARAHYAGLAAGQRVSVRSLEAVKLWAGAAVPGSHSAIPASA